MANTADAPSKALLEFHKNNPDASVDEMLWWLYETHGLVVGVRTIRRVFERNPKSKVRKGKGRTVEAQDDVALAPAQDPPAPQNLPYAPPYVTMSSQETAAAAEQHLAQALQQSNADSSVAPQLDLSAPLPDDEETMQLQLRQIQLQKREVELKLKLRLLQEGKAQNVSATDRNAPSNKSTSSLYNPNIIVPEAPKRDSRSKKKIEESKIRTAQRQERMLRDLERRSRRRDHLTAEWVQSKDIWPLRAQSILADLMHQYGCYTYGQGHVVAFEAIFTELYRLVDLSKGDWNPAVHDEMLRERTKRKMNQLRAKMQKTGEIIGRNDGYAGFQRAENFAGEQAGDAVGDESEMVSEMQAQSGAPTMQDGAVHYQPVPDHHHHQHHQDMQSPEMSYAHQAMISSQGAGQYPMLDQHPSLLPYGQMGGQMNSQNGGMVM